MSVHHFLGVIIVMKLPRHLRCDNCKCNYRRQIWSTCQHYWYSLKVSLFVLSLSLSPSFTFSTFTFSTTAAAVQWTLLCCGSACLWSLSCITTAADNDEPEDNFLKVWLLLRSLKLLVRSLVKYANINLVYICSGSFFVIVLCHLVVVAYYSEAVNEALVG